MLSISLGMAYAQVKAVEEYEYKELDYFILPILFIILSNSFGFWLTSYISKNRRRTELYYTLNDSEKWTDLKNRLFQIAEDIENMEDIGDVDLALANLYHLHYDMSQKLKAYERHINKYLTLEPRIELLKFLEKTYFPFGETRAKYEYMCYELSNHNYEDYDEYFRSEITGLYKNQSLEEKECLLNDLDEIISILKTVIEKINQLTKLRCEITYGEDNN